MTADRAVILEQLTRRDLGGMEKEDVEILTKDKFLKGWASAKVKQNIIPILLSKLYVFTTTWVIAAFLIIKGGTLEQHPLARAFYDTLSNIKNPDQERGHKP